MASTSIASSAGAQSSASTTPTAQAPLIERAKLFGNPSRAGGQISPDGRWLSWLAPRDGVMNIYVAPIGSPNEARALTASTERPIRQHFWSPDSSRVMYVQDKGGDENFLLYAINVQTGEETNLTPFERTRVMVVGTSNTIKDRILVGLNNRDPRWHDVHSLDLNTGRLTEVMRGDGYQGFLADDSLTLRMALKPNAAGGTDFHRIVNGQVEAEPFGRTTLEDALTTSPAGFTTDGRTLYWLDSRGRNTGALIAQDVASGETRVIAESPKADIGSVMVDPVTGEIEAYAVNYLRNEWTAIDPEIGRSLAYLKSNLNGDVVVTSRTDDDSKWIVAVDPVTAPPSTHLYDRRANTLTQLYVSRPELEGAPLVAMYPREIQARDGLTLPSYLTLPPGSDPDGDGRPNAPVPMVLLVHGGPWARDGFGFNGYHQWLANRGYAVLSVNYRGSTGFGKSFISAGDLQWGRKMHDDLIDAVEWAVDQGITPRDKVAIMGGSYGGYATLAGLTFTPTTFACGVDIVGPSNLQTLLSTIPPYWTAGIEQFHQRMGNPNTPEGVAMLRERSPLYSADKIVRPLLIGQGANDPRVNQAESDQIVAAMRERNIPVTYVLFPDEGHGFARPTNNIAFNAVTESFLDRCLGGRSEPIGDTVRQSTAQVPHGAEYAPGLADAIRSR
ncbi:dipeptidyl aminopeptidase/acylaminoacyl peptidase [Sphingomonas jejuensis]|uniref:Dipeptidyl aminopeptidase/acylaminoacyl peptidase n=1 Tax=Sphingomonas jejuensis TaxID=904715 RepID=A0ABX0XKC4_9SPHN|nr:S9 family peptidase [Sphingomonas jejuensis]NJC33700.1 dipeptidyl aminopeptidase/acylaminoacyl peptidase [Sphingomonas jejuensis]